ncbi:acid protease, partial [Saitoella complicata NRRL Y-17804]|uniref:acid protease n=1 Tax=Saitoella complicata (strain BCRC 22490 / CBS 7301 / JCM 7358 / NBRC 10748 / NRRL Y-17804) TaxID=698492 RepID=UPI0008675113
ASVSIGTPPQNITVQLDTGSTDLWVKSPSIPQCEAGNCTLGTYDSSSSSTFNNLSEAFLVQYGDYTYGQGTYATETVVIGNDTITNVTFGYATAANSSESLMGVGLEGTEGSATFTYPTIVEDLYNQSLIERKFFSLYLNDFDSGVGEIIFGGVDNDKFEGDLSGPFPILANPATGQVERYVIPLTTLSLTINGSASNVTGLPLDVLLDSGGQYCQFPPDLVDYVATALGLNSSEEAGGMYFCPCDLSVPSSDDTTDNVLSFSFDNGTSFVNVPFHELIVPAADNDGAPLVDENGNPVCQLGLTYGGSTDYSASYILGDPFLRSAYVAYDIDNLNIYVGQTVFNSTTSNITVFPV